MLGLPHGEVLFHPVIRDPLELSPKSYVDAESLHRGDWTSAWLRNPLGYKTDELHQGQEIPWAGNSGRLKLSCVLALFSPLLLRGTTGLGGPGVWTALAIFTSSLVAQMDCGWNILSPSSGLKSHWPCGNCSVIWRVLALHRTRKRLSFLSTPYHLQFPCGTAMCLNQLYHI